MLFKSSKSSTSVISQEMNLRSTLQKRRSLILRRKSFSPKIYQLYFVKICSLQRTRWKQKDRCKAVE